MAVQTDYKLRAFENWRLYMYRCVDLHVRWQHLARATWRDTEAVADRHYCLTKHTVVFLCLQKHVKFAPYTE